MVFLLVYVDDIILASPSSTAVSQAKLLLQNSFKLKDLGHLKHFLDLEIAYSKQGIFLSERTYCLSLLEDIGFLDYIPTNLPMEEKFKAYLH